jgi:hypothetical protein
MYVYVYVFKMKVFKYYVKSKSYFRRFLVNTPILLVSPGKEGVENIKKYRDGTFFVCLVIRFIIYCGGIGWMTVSSNDDDESCD